MNKVWMPIMKVTSLLVIIFWCVCLIVLCVPNYSLALDENIDDDVYVLPELDKSIQDDLPAGNYYISTSYNLRMCIDVYGGGSKDGTNIDIYSSNCNDSQKWKISYDTKGYATIANYAGKVLDVEGALAKSGANVIQYKNNGNVNQKWIISKENGFYKIKSALSKSGQPDLCLDVYGAFSADCTIVEIYNNNNDKNQRFVFTPIDSQKISGERVVEDGDYSIRAFGNQSMCADLYGFSPNDGTNVDLWAYNKGQNQIFHFTFDENTKCYLIYCVGTAKVLNVHMANPLPGSNVNQYINKNLDEEKWAITKNANGSLLILNRYTGLALDVECGAYKDGTNISTYTPNGGANQNFILKDEALLYDGVYQIQSYVASDRCFDVSGGTWSSGRQIESYSPNGGINQKFVVKIIQNNEFTIRSVVSGLIIAQSSDKIIQTTNEDEYSKWKAVWVGNGIAFENRKSGKVMDVEGMSSSLCAHIIAYKKNGCIGQVFRCVGTDLITGGTFNISPQCALGNTLNISGNSWYIGAQVLMWNNKNENNSKWFIEKVDSKYYRILSPLTEYAVDVSNGSCHDNDRIQQWPYNGGTPQKWQLEFTDDGWFTFKNATNGLYLDCFGEGQSPGNPVGIYHWNGGKSQKWRLSMTSSVSISGNWELDAHLRNICRACPNLNAAYNFVCGYSYRSGDVYPGGEWTIPYALEMIHCGSGNCYRYAALFKWCAIALGYSANAISGGVATIGGGSNPHGWVEIYSGGTYVCDPDLQNEVPGYNFFMITYENAPVTYYR